MPRHVPEQDSQIFHGAQRNADGVTARRRLASKVTVCARAPRRSGSVRRRYRSSALRTRKAPRGSCPPLYIGPVPDKDIVDLRYRRREVIMPPAPVVNDLDPLDAKTLRDLGRTHEEVGVDAASHRFGP